MEIFKRNKHMSLPYQNKEIRETNMSLSLTKIYEHRGRFPKIFVTLQTEKCKRYIHNMYIRVENYIEI